MGAHRRFSCPRHKRASSARSPNRYGKRSLDEIYHNKFDLIVSNPPYISSQDYKTLPPDVRNFEPKLALTSPPDGLQLIRKLIESAPNYLRPNGRLAIEIGKDQRPDVEDFVHCSKKYQKIDFVPDLSGISRVLVVQV